jgi:hypothetical protein
MRNLYEVFGNEIGNCMNPTPSPGTKFQVIDHNRNLCWKRKSREASSSQEDIVERRKRIPTLLNGYTSHLRPNAPIVPDPESTLAVGKVRHR